MQRTELAVPYGAVYLFRNGRRAHFTAETFRYGIYVNSYTLKKPQGLYRIHPIPGALQPGDVVQCVFTAGQLQAGPGDEWMQNLVGTHKGYTIGIGAPDPRVPASRSALGRPPYATRPIDRGFEVRILENLEKYPYEDEIPHLHFVTAWEPGTGEEAKRLISFVTC